MGDPGIPWAATKLGARNATLGAKSPAAFDPWVSCSKKGSDGKYLKQLSLLIKWKAQIKLERRLIRLGRRMAIFQPTGHDKFRRSPRK